MIYIMKDFPMYNEELFKLKVVISVLK